jgi:GT2 family glycosyltransferase
VTDGPAPRVRLVVLNWNGGDLVVRALDHLEALDWPRERLDLVVVDNASSDGSDRVIAERFPGVRLVRNDVNGGFPANNLALRDLDGVDYVGLCNPDSFVEPGWLTPLVQALEADPGLGAASARMLFADRFLEVEVASPTFVPGTADSRELGVMVSGARVDGKDRWRDTQFGSGTWGIEHDRRGGTFQWTQARAVVRVPVPERSGDPVDGPPALPDTIELRLAAEATKDVTLTAGGTTVTVSVGTEPRWVAVPVGGEPLDIVNNVGSQVFTDGFGADRGYLEPDTGQYDEPADVFAWCGGSVLMRPAYLADVGLFDERFFLYYEDTDLSWRGLSRGWRYRYVPEAVTRHIHAASTGEGTPTFQHYAERNRLVMLAKNAPAPMALRAAWRFALVTASYARRDIVRPVLGLHRPNVEQVRRRTLSLLGFLAMLPVILPERRRIRRAANVPDAAVVARLVPR